jgi:hypothetical protein
LYRRVLTFDMVPPHVRLSGGGSEGRAASGGRGRAAMKMAKTWRLREGALGL